jgi:hypothetical protein
MFWIIITGVVCLLISVVFYMLKGSQDFYLDQKEISKENDSHRRFARFGAIILRAKSE